ncbi:MAG TPA: hypothetical protein VMU19_05425 [Bryobacteraceae bacterium]|nr:hypothetical protein [Bryobacteraceae bacterium]
MKRQRPSGAAGVQCLWRTPSAAREFQGAVSLHSHTMHSREGLDFIPRVLRKVRWAHAIVRMAERRHERRSGRPVGYDRAYWRPPLNPQAAYHLEAGQIRDALGLRPMVSLTDHDELEACRELQAIGIPCPYSVEWTVPYGATVFHLGVHNLPSASASALFAWMARYTAQPREELLAEILAALDEQEGVLLVLNHPFLSEERLERADHVRLLMQFLARHGLRMHALELNGLQPASDNREVVRLAGESGIPAISGGDRHCLEPNANVNLTNAGTFGEFVHEVRHEGLSRVLFLPQYRESIAARYIHFIWHAVRTYPDMPGRERWTDRIFFEPFGQPGVAVPLSAEWTDGGPAIVRGFVSSIGFLAAPHMRGALRLAFGEQGEVGA